MALRSGSLALSLVLPWTLLSAQAPPEDDASELLRLLNTPIESASKRAQKAIEAPQAVEVITADQIRASGVFRFVDVLRLATSVQVWDAAPDRATVTIRGVNPGGNPRTVQVLVDGVPLFNLVASPLDLNGLPVPLDAIERVEIVRGPSSSLYGANAQTGVIAVTTKRAKEGFAGSLRAAGVNDGGARGAGFAALGGDRFSLTAAVAGSSDRNRVEGLPYVANPALAVPNSAARREQQVYLKPELDLGQLGKVWAAFGSGDTGHMDVTSRNAATLAGLAVFPNQAIVRQIMQAGWSSAWSPVLRTELRVDQKTLRLSMDPIRPDPTNPASPTIVGILEAVDPALAAGHDFYYDRVREVSLQVNWDPASNLHVVAGGDTRAITTGACRTIGLAEELDFTATGAFVSVDWTLDAVTLSAGARAANESLGGATTSPRFSVVWDLGASGLLRAGYFTSTRSPMVQEKLASIGNIPVVPYLQIPNPGIKPEKAADFEVGYRKNWEQWSLDLTYFQTTLRGLIASVPTGATSGGKPVDWFANNPTDFDDSGIELALTGELAHGWLLGFNAATATFKDPIYGLDQQADYTPKGTANLWSRYRRGAFFAYGGLQYVAKYTVATPSGAAILRQEVPAGTQVHFNVGVEPLKGVSVSVYGVNAGKAAADVSNGALLNQYAIRTTHREVGVQASYRF